MFPIEVLSETWKSPSSARTAIIRYREREIQYIKKTSCVDSLGCFARIGFRSYLVHPLERVAAVSVLIDPTIRGTVVREEHQASVVALGGVSQQVESRVVVEQKVLGVASLRTNDIRSLDRITTEKDWEVKSDNVVVALSSVKLDSETSRVASLIGELSAKGDGRETNKGRGLLARTLEEVGLGHV
jgi:hypothetical protein